MYYLYGYVCLYVIIFVKLIFLWILWILQLCVDRVLFFLVGVAWVAKQKLLEKVELFGKRNNWWCLDHHFIIKIICKTIFTNTRDPVYILSVENPMTMASTAIKFWCTYGIKKKQTNETCVNWARLVFSSWNLVFLHASEACIGADRLIFPIQFLL